MQNYATFVDLGDESHHPKFQSWLVMKLIHMINGIEKCVSDNQLILNILNNEPIRPEFNNIFSLCQLENQQHICIEIWHTKHINDLTLLTSNITMTNNVKAKVINYINLLFKFRM